MAPLQKWFARMLPTGSTRGLSGDLSSLLAADPRDTWYNERLRCHRTDADLVDDPSRLWEAPAMPRGICGLHSHLTSLASGERMPCSHLLVVVSGEDLEKAAETYGDHWRGDAEAHLVREVLLYFERTGTRPAFPTQLPRIYVVPDGDPELMKGHRLGLAEGEWVTGTVPNFHHPATDSDVDLAIYVALGEGDFQEVGHLHTDQLLFTVGNHWLDNFRSPEVPGAALYQLYRNPRGGFVQVVNPDLSNDFTIEHSTGDEAADVITVKSKQRGVVARIVLAVRDKTLELPPGVGSKASEPTDAGKASGSTGDSLSLRPVPLPTAATPSGAAASPTIYGQLTIVPDVMEETYVTLVETGALLQRIHFSKVMEGYDVYLSTTGHLSTTPGKSMAIFQVRGQMIQLQVEMPGVTVNGSEIPAGARVEMSGTAKIAAAGHEVELRTLTHVKAPGWPYLAEIRRTGATTHLGIGSVNRIGRAKNCRIRLPDQHHNENIAWRGGSGARVQARSGEVERSRFHTDSIMVASEHAEVNLQGRPLLKSMARHCYSYVRRGDHIVTLHPTARDPGPREEEIQHGDEILIGNCLFTVRAEASSDLSASMLSEAAAPQEDVLPLPALPNPPRKQEPSPALSISEAPTVGKQGDEEAPPRSPPPSPRFANTKPMAEAPEPGPVAPKPKEGEPEPAPTTPSASNTDPGTAAVVVWVDEEDLETHLAQPAHVIHLGWMVAGTSVLGNHMNADLILPELRMEERQQGSAKEYARLVVKGRRGSITLLDTGETNLRVGEEDATETDTLEDIHLEVLRRDADGEVDFTVGMHLEIVLGLPNPRGRLLLVDREDPLCAAMLTQGVPEERTGALHLGHMRCRAKLSDGVVVLEDYMESRQTDYGGLLPFYMAKEGASFVTVPRSGQPLSLASGDRLLVGGALYRITVGA